MKKILLIVLVSLTIIACDAITQSASKAFDNANSAISDKVFIPEQTPTPAHALKK